MWEAHISTLYDLTTSTDVIAHITLHRQCVSQNSTVSTLNTSNMALQADAKVKKPEKQCTNCHRRGHLVEACYWPGGGKEGQFPPGFGNASDHYFANKTNFSAYELFPELHEGQVACHGAKFRILGKGTIVKTFISEGQWMTLTFHNVLHTPNFTANLISVSRFDAARFKVLFGGGHAQFIDPKGKTFVTASHANGMYTLLPDLDSTALSAKSHEKPTSIDTWH
ncbi:hypothetical protein NLJ89_g11093 [Agrocybe chaxingu]|uniref:Retrovirus-related Pol polyprotein from transposon TNT 1-94-like beta-barrel domain-containing protein n=1 Tax=Agrocybe chaxingu TaxID=84603 RepID=A0A9W8MRY7_9AGAR|nr:hypothetical protein NLJ89_g11093 [Agrocybe chaxingu]